MMMIDAVEEEGATGGDFFEGLEEGRSDGEPSSNYDDLIGSFLADNELHLTTESLRPHIVCSLP